MKPGGLLKECHPTAQPHREQLNARTVSPGRNEQLFKGAFVKTIAGGEIQGNDTIQLLLVQQQSFADKVTNEVAAWAKTLEPKGQQLQVCRRGECSRLSKACHYRFLAGPGTVAFACERAESQSNDDITKGCRLRCYLLAQIFIGDEIEEAAAYRLVRLRPLGDQSAYVPITLRVDEAGSLGDQPIGCLA